MFRKNIITKRSTRSVISKITSIIKKIIRLFTRIQNATSVLGSAVYSAHSSALYVVLLGTVI